MNKDVYALENFKNIQDLIKFMDQKAGVLLVVYGFMFTVYVQISNSLTLDNNFWGHDIIHKFFSLSCFISGSLFIILSVFEVYIIIFRVIQPKLAVNYKNDEICLYYFKHISSLSKENFITKFNKFDEKNILNEILGQVYEVSKIVDEKQKKLCVCNKILFICIIVLIIYALTSRLI